MASLTDAMTRRAVGCLLSGVLLGGCFVGDATIGAVCSADADCGEGQTCQTQICGYCGDGLSQPGELCLQPAQELAGAPMMSAGPLQAIDVDGDGNLDLLLRGVDGRPELWSGDGRGAWARRTTLDGVGVRGAVETTALDDDATIDLVVADDDAPALWLGRGDGAGAWTFGDALPLTAAADDLVVGSAIAEGPVWLSWVDAGGWWQVQLDDATGLPGEPVRIDGARTLRLGEPALFDDDGVLDLAVVDVTAMQLEVWLGDGAGGLVRGETQALEARPFDAVVRDLDGDGDADVLVPDEDGGVTLVIGNGQGGLSLGERLEVPGPARSARVADLNRDGTRDVIVQVDDDEPLWVFLGRGVRHPDGIALEVDAAVGSTLAIDGDRDGLVELLLGPAQGVAALRTMEVTP